MSTTADQSNTGISDGVSTGITPRPDKVGNSSTGLSAGLIWNPNAFQSPPNNAGRIGNAGVGILEAPGTIALSAGLAKTFQAWEGTKIRFESTFNSVLNHTNYAPPASDISDPSTFGVLTSAQTAGQNGNRTGQLALRIDF
jgi:hypothetical protein